MRSPSAKETYYQNRRHPPADGQGASRRDAVVHVLVEHPGGRRTAALLRAWGCEFMKKLGVSGELSVVLTTDRRIRGLNRRHRGVNRSTDVISFPGVGAILVGDVVVSLDAARRAEASGRGEIGEELRRYLAHGILHLVGHDHGKEGAARKMAREERRLLGVAGMLLPLRKGLASKRAGSTRRRRQPRSRT